MNTIKPFTCAECGGVVTPQKGTGRTEEYVRGYNLPIPDEFLIPTCNKCGAWYIVSEIEAKLRATMRKQFLQMQAKHYTCLVSTLRARHGVLQKDVVRACGVTPSYMSHVLAGKRQASETLTRLLEAFVACESEFLRHVKGDAWTAGDINVVAMKATSANVTRGWQSPPMTQPKWSLKLVPSELVDQEHPPLALAS